MTVLQIFDVEHGNCALLTCTNSMRMLIDCGHNTSMGWYPGNHLRGLNVSYLDMLVVTNYDQDHLSGFPNLADCVSIGNIVRNTSVAPNAIRGLKSDDGNISPAMDRFVNTVSYQFEPPGAVPALQFPGVEWTAHRNAYPAFTDENNLSLALSLRIGAVTLLFPGDLETAGWRYLLRTDQSFVNVAKHTTVLIASHHGRTNGICPELFDEYGCRPELVIISDDCHQYDTQATTSYYGTKASGIKGFRGRGDRRVLTTRDDGSITIKWGSTGCSVE